ncbi:MBOAT family protein [Saccharothrix violaceirubra]|uniref:Alginate O-acetyltransferase complex protein AlgI n=1 Tax=Saccharothrix violaceirubra TaxID=413306 RepID=A0A7W7T939_9PSEU|nr:MBOAT family protein [Saccharothrix violaceirubra]MBB4968848.1 alginate O-acetyltransferase complex protein AlgI [Saccharothrix violaceirubra]
MSFASPLFLWFFLPVVLAVLLIVRPSWRNGVVAVASLFFYATGAGGTTFLLIACMVANYLAGARLEPGGTRTDHERRNLLVAVIVFDLAVLVVWKYLGFATEQLHAIASVIGADLPVVHLALPIGISFYTFHHISYVVDVYRGERTALKDPVSFVAYIAMFPQLIAGPIVRFREISDQLPQERTHRLDDIAAGFPRFALGLCKKVIVADSIAPLVDACFATPADRMTFAVAWLGAIGYTLQLYFDFSGYSDMAIGLGRMLGFRLPENFARPYSAVTITEFWRRWHMSLSRWFRDYVYIPLGGNRGGTALTYRNLAIVFVLTGFWHGANWTFLAWGLFHGALLVLERRFGWHSAPDSRSRAIVRRIATVVLVAFGWVFFRSADLGTAWTIIGTMLVPDFAGLPEAVASAATNQRIALLLIAAIVLFLPDHPVTGPFIESSRGRIATTARVSLMTVGVVYSAILIASGTFSPFLYYQF